MINPYRKVLKGLHLDSSLRAYSVTKEISVMDVQAVFLHVCIHSTHIKNRWLHVGSWEVHQQYFVNTVSPVPVKKKQKKQ